MLDDQLAALRAMPVYFENGNGILQEGAPDARVLAQLEALQLIVKLGDGKDERWALTMEGMKELRRWQRGRVR